MARRALRRLARANPAVEPYLGWLLAEARRGDPADIIAAGHALERYDARPFASSLHVPAAVVVTTRDAGVRPAKQRELATTLGANQFEIAGDHFCFLAKTKEFADVTRATVDDVVSRSTATPVTPVTPA